MSRIAIAQDFKRISTQGRFPIGISCGGSQICSMNAAFILLKRDGAYRRSRENARKHIGTRIHSTISANIFVIRRLPPFVHSPSFASSAGCDDSESSSDGWYDESSESSSDRAIELSSDELLSSSSDRSHTSSPGGKTNTSLSRRRCNAPMRADSDRHRHDRGVTSRILRGVTRSNAPPLTRRTRISVNISSSSESSSAAARTVRGMRGRGWSERHPTADRCTKKGRDGTNTASPRRSAPSCTQMLSPVARATAAKASRSSAER